MGRPSTYKKEACDILLKAMSKGHSFEASCAEIGICKDTGYEWIKKYPAFAKAKKEGEAAALKLLESYALADLSGVIPEPLKKHGSRKINTVMAIFLLKTRFHKIYGDRTKLEGLQKDETKGTITLAYQDPVKEKKAKKKKTK